MFPRPRLNVSYFKNRWFAIEAIPLYFCVGGMIGAGLWYGLARVALGPDVVWTRRNPAPWLTIEDDETTKLGTRLGEKYDASGTPQHTWNRRWSRLKSVSRLPQKEH